jgi:hypothetical protein
MRAAIAILFMLSGPMWAADVTVVGDQAILSGQIDGNELAQLRDIAAQHGATISTVILRESHSGGGTFNSMRMAADFIRDRGWRTAVSGVCSAGCSILFLGGASRHFTDDRPPGSTRIGFTRWNFAANSNRRSYQKGDTNPIGANTVRNWIKESTQGMISDEMLDQITPLTWHDEHYAVSFFDSRRLRREDGASVFACSLTNPAHRNRDNCEKIATDAYRQGIVTSAELIHSNDRQAAKPRGPASAPAPTPPGPAK